MSRGVEDIIGRLDGVAPASRRVDRDARRALLAVAAVAAVFTGIALLPDSAGSGGASPASDRDETASTDLLGAFERISVPAAEEGRPTDESPTVPATRPTPDGYESIEAIAPGRRT